MEASYTIEEYDSEATSEKKQEEKKEKIEEKLANLMMLMESAKVRVAAIRDAIGEGGDDGR